MRSSFFLSKWYFDCVSDDGNVFIGYIAEARWGSISISYSSTLQHRHGRKVETSISLRRSAPPQVADSDIRWVSPRLNVAGQWTAMAQPIKRRLLESESGYIEWNCWQPGARAEITLGNRRIEGTGYVDQVTMTIPPWRLPFEQLRWGRFLSNKDALLWLSWEGQSQINLAFHNGISIENSQVDERAFKANNLILDLEKKIVLREGPLTNTALATVPGIDRLLPKSILQSYECKWLSRGTLEQAGSSSQSGWAIHEIVCFGKEPN